MAAYRAQARRRRSPPRPTAVGRRSGGRHRTATTGSPWTGTRSGWRCWTAMSTRSSAPTPATGRWPHGSQDTAEALAEIGEFDLAIDWARQALDVGPGHQSLKAGGVLVHVAGRAPSGRSCSRRGWRCSAAGPRPAPPRACIATRARRGRSTAMRSCSGSRRARVMRCCSRCCRSKDVQHAWELAHSLALDDDRTWSDLVKAYEKVDPLAVLPVLNRLVAARAGRDRSAALPDRRSQAEEDAQARRRIRTRSRDRLVHRRAARGQPSAPAATTGVRPSRPALRLVITVRSR